MAQLRDWGKGVFSKKCLPGQLGAIRVQARASLLGFFSPSLSRVIYQINCHLETWRELGFFVSENLGFYTLSLARAGTNSPIPLGLVFPFYKQRRSAHRVAIRMR